MLQAKEHAPLPFSSVVFILGIAFESFQEFGGASQTIMWLKDWKNTMVLNLKLNPLLYLSKLIFEFFDVHYLVFLFLPLHLKINKNLLFNCLVGNYFCLGTFSPFLFIFEGEGPFDGGYVSDDLGEDTFENSNDWDKPWFYFDLGGIQKVAIQLFG
jgi:hypothetical protein